MLTFRFNTSINNLSETNLHLNSLFDTNNLGSDMNIQYRYEHNSIVPK
jgi:hypothetical protein